MKVVLSPVANYRPEGHDSHDASDWITSDAVIISGIDDLQVYYKRMSSSAIQEIVATFLAFKVHFLSWWR